MFYDRLAPAAAAAALLLASPAQIQWTQLNPGTAPTARCLHSIVDAGPLGVILFGGERSYAASWYVADTWRWANGNWVAVPTANAPSPRGGGALCYDPIRNRVVQFSGWNGGGYLGDTWEFDGSNWSDVTPVVSPPGRDWASVAFDPISRRVILFGGHDWTLPLYQDTWSWDGATWTQLAPTHSPPGLFGCGMVTCEAFGLIVLHGGQQSVGTWIWLGTDWAMLPIPSATPARILAPVAWDALRQRAVLIAGTDIMVVFQDVHEFDGSSWIARSPVTAGPAIHDGAAFFDRQRGEVVVFGGCTSLDRSVVTNTTWSLGPTTAAIGQSFGSSCGNAPVLDASHLAWLGDVYQVDSSGVAPGAAVLYLVGLSRSMTSGALPLPLSLAANGMPGCALLVDPLASAFVLANPAGHASNAFVVPPDVGLLGIWIYSQVAMPSSVNAAGLVLSAGTAHRLGGK